MSSLPITPPAKARVDLAPKSSSPPSGGSGLGDFAALLNQTSARTAPAEGQNTRPASSEQQTRRRDDDVRDGRRAADRDDHASTDAASTPATDEPKAQDADGSPASDPKNGGQQAPDKDAGTPADASAAAQQPAAPTTDAQKAAAAAAALAAASTATPSGSPAPATASTAAGAGTTATGATAPDLAPAAAAAAALAPAKAGPPADGSVAAGTDAAGKLQIPAELLGGKAPNKLVTAKDTKNAQDGLPPLPTLPPSAGAAAAALPTAGGAAGGDAGANAGQQGAQSQAQPQLAPSVATGQPTATPLTAVPTAAGSPQLTKGSLVQTAERVHELVRIATTRSGNARATLQLKPEALGQVDVQLRTTKDGLVATIAAHDQAGLDALQNAANELRRTLSDRGVELHSLDLQLGSGDTGFSNQGDARQANSGRSGSASSYGLEDDDVVAEDELTLTTPTSTPAGALVDVQA